MNTKEIIDKLKPVKEANVLQDLEKKNSKRKEIEFMWKMYIEKYPSEKTNTIHLGKDHTR